MVGLKLKRRAHVGVRAVELPRPFQRDAAGIKREPRRLLLARLGQQLQRAVVGGDRVGPLVLLAQKIAERGPGRRQVRLGAGQRAGGAFGVGHALGLHQRLDPREFGDGAHLAGLGQCAELMFGQVELPDRLQDLRRDQPRLAQVGGDVAGEPGMDQGQRVGILACGQRAGKCQEHLRHAVGGGADRIEGQRLARFQPAPHLDQHRLVLDPVQLVDQRDGVGVAVQLRQHLRLRDQPQQVGADAGPGHHLVRALVVAHTRAGEAKVILRHRLGPGHLLDVFERGHRLCGLARTQKRPGAQHPVEKRAAPRPLVAGRGGDAVQHGLPVALMHELGPLDDPGQRGGRVAVHQLDGKVDGPGQLPG